MGKEIYRKYLKQKSGNLVFLILVIGVGVALSGLSPYVFGKIIDTISGEMKGDFKVWILLYALLLVIAQIFSVLESLAGQWVITSIENSMKSRLMGRVVRIKSRSADKFENGELLNRLEFDAETVGDYYIDLVSSILMIAVNLVVSIYFIFHISLQLSLVSVLFFPLMYGVNFIFRKKVRSLETEQKKITDQYYSFIDGIFSFLNPVKTFGIQKQMEEDFENFLKKRFRIEIKNTVLISEISMLRSLLGGGLNVVLLMIAGIFITHGQMTVGNLITFNSYLDMLFQAITKILELNLNRQGVLVSYERLQELEKEPLETEQDGTEVLDMEIKMIQFQEVSFSYRLEETVLNGLSFSITEPGIYSLVGENGCGKTTILKLLEHLYDVEDGNILINSKKLNDYQVASLRSQIAYMEKEPFFFHGTIYENLQIGNEVITEEKMQEACRLTGIHRDIMDMEQRYCTLIEKRGRNLSSGQKQKLGLSRLFLRNQASLYLLDEVTSDLDGRAEKNVADILEKLAENTIIISVSHKKELLKRSKEIFVLQDGKIADQGTHQELLTKSDLYKKLYSLK